MSSIKWASKYNSFHTVTVYSFISIQFEMNLIFFIYNRSENCPRRALRWKLKLRNRLLVYQLVFIAGTIFNTVPLSGRILFSVQSTLRNLLTGNIFRNRCTLARPYFHSWSNRIDRFLRKATYLKQLERFTILMNIGTEYVDEIMEVVSGYKKGRSKWTHK